MTVEELEIIVTAKVEEAVREVMKLAPAIKEAMKQAQETLSKVDTKTMQNKFQQAVQFMKKKMQDLKKSTQNNEIAIKVNNKEAQQQISQLEKEIDSLHKKIEARQMKLNTITPRLDEITSKTTKEVTPNGVSPDNPAIQQTINNSLAKNQEYNTLIAQEQKMTQEIAMYSRQLNEAKNKMTQLKQETSQTATTQDKLSSFFGTFKAKLDQAKSTIGSFKNSFKQMPKLTQNITNNIKNMGKGLKQGLGHILRYAGALFSLRGIYSILSNSTQSWLSSQNAGAKQLSANIDYMKYAMGSAFGPVIQWVTNLVYQLMKAIQSVVYALFKVNIFANASAKSYGAMAGSAKKAKEETKQLAGIHDEINNIQNNDNSDSGSGNGGTVAPSFDLSGIDSQMSNIAQKLYDFFKPLKESWDNYGSGLIEQVKITAGQVGELIASVWGSFENIITNGTVYTSLELILAIIGNIAQAFANAWNYNGNGDAIIQNLANAFNNLLGAINNVVQSEVFQSWLNWCSDKFREISEKIASIDWQPLINALANIGTNIGSIALEILSALVDVFKWLAENPNVAEILLAIAIAIGVVGTVLSVISGIMAILNPILTATQITLLPLIGIIAAIIAVVALIVLAIMNWDTITKALADTWNWICGVLGDVCNSIGQFFANLWQGIRDIFSGIGQWFSDRFTEAYNFIVGIFQGIGQWFSDRWNDICNIFNGIGQWFSDKFTEAYNSVVNIFSKVGDFFSGVWQGICNIFGNVSGWFKDKFSQAWEAVKKVFSAGGRIFDGIKDGILNGLKTVINAIIGGINKVIAIPFNGINTALRAIKSVNIMGLQPFSWINTIGVPQIPTLAKGGVLYDDTIVRAGEYTGANTNPEIVTPQNIMRETMEEVFSKYQGNNNGQPIHLQMYWGSKKIVDEVIDGINEKTRQTGKMQIKYT